MFSYCPKCGAKYSSQALPQQTVYRCDACLFCLYNNPKPVPVAFLFNSEQNTLLLTRRKFAPEQGKWGLPGGFMEYNETPEKALKREMQEELSVDVSVGSILVTYNCSYANSGRKEEVYSVLVLIYETTIFENQQIHVADDVSDARYFCFEDMPELGFENQDQTVRRLFKARVLLNSNV